MAIREEITLDLLKPMQYINIRLQQNDGFERKVDVLLTTNGSLYTIPSTSTVALRMQKRDGSPIYNQCELINSNKVSFTVTPQMTALSGRQPAQLQVIDNVTGGILKTVKFHMLIDEEVVNDSMIINSGEFTALENAMLRIGDLSLTEEVRVTNENTRIQEELARKQAEIDRANRFETEKNALINQKSQEIDQAKNNKIQEMTNASATKITEITNAANAQATEIANRFDTKMTEIDTQFSEKYDGLEQEYATDLTTVKSQLAQIAYQKAPQTEVDDIQMQVHELVLNAGNPEASSAEINQARVNALGKSYDTLKAHLNDIENGKSLNEKSINLSKLESFAREGLFITDPLSIVKGSAVQWYDGTFASSSTYDRTDFIPVKAGYLFGSKYNYHIAFYDANKTYKSGLSGASYTFPVTVPQGAHYAIINVDKSQTDYWYRLSGNLDHYLDKSFLNIDLFPDNSTEKKDIIFKDLKIIKNSLGILDEIFSFVGNMNKYNPAEEEVGYYYQWSNGVKTSNVAYKSSGLIPVKEGEKVACSKRYHITYWSYNNTYLSGIAGGWTGYLTIPKDAYYMRATFNATDTECYITNDIANPRYFTYGTLGYIFKDNLGDKFKLFNKENIGQRSNLYGKKVNLLGDSITSINYTLPTWWQNITSKTGAVFNNYGISGTTLAHTDDRHLWDFNFGRLDAATIGYVASNPATWSTGNCFCERYDNMDTTADGVVVMGGTNDGSVPLGTWSSTDTSTFYGALNVLITGLLNIYAGKPILFCTPIQSNTAYQTNVIDPFDVLKNTLSTATMTLQIRAEAIKAKCKQYGVDCLDLYNLSGINGADTNKIYYRSGDTLHPSSYGQERIEALVCAELERMFVKSI